MLLSKHIKRQNFVTFESLIAIDLGISRHPSLPVCLPKIVRNSSTYSKIYTAKFFPVPDAHFRKFFRIVLIVFITYYSLFLEDTTLFFQMLH